MITYWSRLINGKHNKLAFILYRKMRASDGMHSNWVLNIQPILEECDRPYLWLNQSCNHYCSKIIKSVLEAQFSQNWSTILESSSKCLNYSLFKDSINLGPIFIKLPRSLFIHLGKLTTGNHRFPCKRGRWQGLDINKRKCTLCNCLEAGDEFHYLLVCSFFSSERKWLMEKHYYSNPNILKYKELMNCTDERRLKDLCVFAKILIKMYSYTKTRQYCYSVFPRHIFLFLNGRFSGCLNN